MSVDEKPLIGQLPARAPVTPFPAGRGHGRWRRPKRRRRRLRKLRILSILGAFAVLALISALFGMLMAVASDLPALKVTPETYSKLDSFLYDDQGRPIGVLAPPGSAVIDTWTQISPMMVNAIISVEDKRFWSDPGIDIRGLLRAAINNVRGLPTQGASTIAEQFVKVRLQQEGNRTILEKLREAALAFQLVHHWHRYQILTDYLNAIYFGNGANGIEAAARVYFGKQLGYEPNAPGRGLCGDATVQHPNLPKCAKLLDPAQAAMLAGMVANPSAFNPIDPDTAAAAKARRDLVLHDMFQQRYITQTQYDQALNSPLPSAQSIQQPAEPPAAPYFTSWVRPQIVAALQHEGVPASKATYDAYYGGLKIRLTIDLALQQEAQQVVDSVFQGLPSPAPTATLVAIDNHTGEVRAMVSGSGDYQQNPFNLAVDGERQPGSSFKLFTLAAAISSGRYGPYSVIDSHPLDIPFRDPIGRIEQFKVRNFGNFYSGPMSLASATAVSDNTVFAQVGMGVGTHDIAGFAHKMGIRTSVSTNPSMILGGLTTGVSALDMAHAYETEATGGLKVFNPVLGDVDRGPIGIHSISGCGPCRLHDMVNRPHTQRVLSPAVAATIRQLLEGVVAPGGTASQAEIPGVPVAGKTGTTTNYVDAWFVGFTPQLTTAVWVGYPNGAVPMLTQWQGQPVEGGSYPALIWRDFTVSALQTLSQESAGPSTTTTNPASTLPAAGTTTPLTATAPATSTTTPSTTNTPATTTGPATNANGATTTPATGAGTPGGTGTTGAANGGTPTTGAGAPSGGGTQAPGTGAGGGTTGAGSGTGAGGAGSAGGTATPTPAPGAGGSTSTTGGAGLGG